jgi:hypothetical protein
MNHKKNLGQAWGFDLLIGSILFLAALSFLYLYTINLPEGNSSNFAELAAEGDLIAESLLSEGYPIYWNKTDVVRIGLLNEGEINETKLKAFNELTNNEITRTKFLLNVRNTYYVNFSRYLDVDGTSIEGIGSAGTNPDNVVIVSRVSNYKGEIISLNIQVWS